MHTAKGAALCTAFRNARAAWGGLVGLDLDEHPPRRTGATCAPCLGSDRTGGGKLVVSDDHSMRGLGRHSGCTRWPRCRRSSRHTSRNSPTRREKFRCGSRQPRRRRLVAPVATRLLESCRSWRPADGRDCLFSKLADSCRWSTMLPRQRPAVRLSRELTVAGQQSRLTTGGFGACSRQRPTAI